MNRRLAGVDNSLNAMLGQDADSEWLEMLPDEGPSQETLVADADELSQRRTLLGKALDTLNPREREILTERRLKDDPSTLEELSHRYAVSRERIRQIEVRAFEKLQKAMLNAANAPRPQDDMLVAA